MTGRTLLVALLVVLAGCGATSSTPDATTAPTATTEPSTTQATSTSKSTTETTTTQTTRTTEAPPANPWQTEVIYVGVDINTDARNRQLYIDAVENATDYWNDAYTQYSPFEDVYFEVSPNHSNPDIEVDIVDTIASCGGSDDETTVGCADVYEPGEVASGTSYVEIESGYTSNSTNTTVRHEFGHMLGLEHGDEPMPLMAATNEYVQQEATDAVNRSYPWTKTNLTVAVVGTPTDEQRDQIQHALTYFEDGADGLLPDRRPSFTMTDNRTTADILIIASDDANVCGQEYSGGSCASSWGYNDDTDRALEYYGRLEITLAHTDSDTTAWHVAYWMAIGFGAQGDEIPEPLDGEDDNRDSNWWS